MFKEIKISLEVVVDKEKQKVVFAEANGDFVDILLSFLTLPMGTIIRLLRKHFGSQAPNIGCFNNLYDTVSNLDVKYFDLEESKHLLLNTFNYAHVACKKLKLNIDDSKAATYFKYCNYCSCFYKDNIYMSTFHSAK